MRIKHNPLLMSVGIALAAYWSLGWYVPGVLLSTCLSIFSVLVGVAILFKYIQGFIGVLFWGHRSLAEDGAHLAALGIPAIAAAIVWGGTFTLSWNIAGQPPEWLGTPASNFSRFLLVAGCIALYFTPDAQRDKLSLNSVAWLLIIMATAILTAFFLGAYMGDSNRLNWRPAYWTYCGPGRPLWAATHSRYYHSLDSPYRRLVKARGCFETEEEAQAAGFIPVPRLNVKKPET